MVVGKAHNIAYIKNLNTSFYLPAAKKHYARVLEIVQRFREDHPATATVRNNLEFLADV